MMIRYFHINRQPPRNTSPEIIDQIWLNDDELTTGVQIIELNSSDNPQTSPDEEKQHEFSHVWKNHDQFHESLNAGCEANHTARERRRMQNESRCQYNDIFNAQNDFEEEFMYECFGQTGNNDGHGENVILNHQMNYFTIVDNHYVTNSDSSSDSEYENIEEIQCDNVVHDYNWNSENEDAVTYEESFDREKRTIWIYSFKNKHLLSDNDFELVNIPSKDASSSCSVEEIEGPTPLNAGDFRVATPIPSSYVPRLHLPLSPTLPTVTEVTEPNRQSSSNQTDKSVDVVRPKSINNWLTNKNATGDNDDLNDKIHKQNSCDNIINWMALSPRDKKRRFRNTSPIPQYKEQLSTLRKVNSHVDKQSPNQEHSKETRRSIVTHIRSAMEADSARRSIATTKSSASAKPIIIDETFDKIEADIEADCVPEDRGDHKKRFFRKPQIRFSPKPVSNFAVITEPIEKLDGDNWILEEQKNNSTLREVYEAAILNRSRRPDVYECCAGDRLQIRNMSLLKPAHWNEYLQISGSLPSLQMSVNSESVSESQSWLTRLGRFFRCCK